MPLQQVSVPATWRCSRPALFFHWLLAALIPFQNGLGWYMLSIEDTPGSAAYFALHVSLGLTATLLIALRLMWRLRNRPAALPATLPAWQVKVASLTHLLLYVLLVLMPITGFLGASLSGEPFAFFGIPLPSWTSGNDTLKAQFFTAHAIIVWALVALVSLHVLGALKHLLIDKDSVFGRMWPSQS